MGELAQPGRAGDNASGSVLRRGAESASSTLARAETLEATTQLAGGIADDVGGVLRLIRHAGEEALRRAQQGEDGVVDDLHGVLEATAQAEAVVRKLLAVGCRQAMEPEALDLNDLVAELTRVLPRRIDDGIEVLTSLERPACVWADRVQLEQVIANLAVNACEAMPRGGTLRFTVRARAASDPHAAELAVSDTGQGMDARTLERAFDPYFTTKEAPGAGLGLATVYGIVTQSGGRILARSTRGAGTTFTILLPLSDLRPGTGRRPRQA